MESSEMDLVDVDGLERNPVEFKEGGMQVDAEHLCYSIAVSNDGTVKTILNDVNFRLRPGSLCALMGPSGSGKSTLLDLLADRKLIGRWSGEIYFNHGPRSRYFNRDSAYILQDNLHFATLTVRETVHYSACFRLPEGTAPEVINNRVDELVKLMGLSHVANSLVGDTSHKGISGGQMKRLSIAVEIVHLPDLIFLDEPTSGLDSTMALEVMAAVKKLSNQSRTCITTIHQPSPEVFELFDKVVLLCEGRLLYYGSSKRVIDYFTSESLNYFFEEGQNPAEFIIDIGDAIIKPIGHHKALTIQELEKLYLQSEYRYVPPSVEAINAARVRVSTAEKEDHGRLHATSKSTQFYLLTHRNVVAMVRDTPEIKAQIGKNFIVGVLVGIIFYQQAVVTKPLFQESGIPEPEVTNISSLLFFGTMYTMVSNSQAIPYLISRNLIFRREIASFSYSVAPYWLSLCLTIIPLQLIAFTCFALPTYFMCSFPQNAGYFFYFYWLMFFSSINSFYFAMFLAAATQSQQVAFILFPLTFLFLSTFAGYAIPVDDIPPFWIGAPYMDFVRWVFEGLMVNQWEDYDDDSTGSTVLELYGFEGYNKGDSFWIINLATGIIVLGVYIAMRPPKKRIEKLEYESMMRASVQEQSGPLPKVELTSNPLREKLLNESEAYAAAPLPVKKITTTVESGKSQREIKFETDSSGLKPLHGYNLTFRDVSYKIDVKNPQTGKVETLLILETVSGRVEPNEMCALMGASGAGKSTLLDVLADRKTTGETTGEIFINGKPRTKAMMKSTAYVMQDNAHIAALTVKETLYFAALLRLPQEMSEAAKEDRMQDIMRVLGLHHIADSIVGDEARRGISGGQKKRLSIGVEIIHLPEMIFLDEPTTGLDSAIAYEVMYAVRQIANQNRTILCTIHQPSTHTFELFDTVMLLGEGQMFYYGKRVNIVKYFSNSIYQFPFKQGINPADYILAISCQSLGAGLTNEKITPPQLIEMYQQTSSYKEFYSEINILLDQDLTSLRSALARNLSEGLDRKGDENDYYTSQYYQIKVLCARHIVRKRRDYLSQLFITARYMFVGIFFGTIYYQLSTGTDPNAYTNRLSVLYFTLMTLLMNHQKEIAEIHEDRLIYYREKSAHAYNSFSYWAAKFLITIPIDLFNTFLYAVLLYYLVGFRTSNAAFGFFLMIIWISNLISVSVCQFIAFISPTTEIGMSLFPVIMFYATSFEGFIVYLPQFPDWLGWIANISFLRFCFQALVLNEFQGNPDLPLANDYIDELGFNTFSKTECASFLLVFIMVHVSVSYLALEYINYDER